MLASHFIEKVLCHSREKGARSLSQEALNHLMLRDWPGNIRELENVIERGIIMAAGDTLFEEDLLTTDSFSSANTGIPHAPGDIFAMPFKEAKDRLIEEFQTQYIAKALARHGGNVSQAARDSGVKRQYLHRLMRDTNLASKTFKKPDPSE